MALSREQIKQLWIQQGGAPKWADAMAGIALRESGGRPGVNNRGLNKNGTVDWGLFQVNDIWRKDPVIGKLFKSGEILTAEGGTKAAIRILKVQGPEAWKSSGGVPTPSNVPGSPGSLGGGRRGTPAKTVTKTVPGVDRSALRTQLIAQFVSQGGADNPNALMGLASALPNAKDTPARKVVKTIPGKPGRPPVGSSDGPRGAKTKGPLFELFWQGQGGINVDNGNPVPQGFVSGHTDHVHVAAKPGDVVRLGKLAQRMGLHVGENPHFGGVNPVHVNGSFHYKNEAIDVSGDPVLMRKFAHRVARIYGIQ